MKSSIASLERSLTLTCSIACADCSFVGCRKNPDYIFKNTSFVEGDIGVAFADDT